jgi:hypothetical protein
VSSRFYDGENEMIKINGKEVEWESAPNFVNNVQRKVTLYAQC